MAYRTETASPTATPSPASSSSASSYVHPSSLDPMPSAEEHDSSNSAQGTPNHSSSSLPRTQSAGKGGCWYVSFQTSGCRIKFYPTQDLPCSSEGPSPMIIIAEPCLTFAHRSATSSGKVIRAKPAKGLPSNAWAGVPNVPTG